MFNTYIECPKPLKPIKDKVCVRITCEPGTDDSLFLTALMLLHNRIDDLKLTYTCDNVFDSDIISLNPEVFSIHWFKYNTNPDELLKPVKNQFKSIEKLPTHEKFLSDTLKQQIFIRLMPHENTVCIFTEKITLPVWHSVQFFIPKFYSVFKEKPLTKDETSFLESLTFKSGTNYSLKINDFINTGSFANYLLKNQLESFEKKMFEKKVESAQRTLNDYESKMEIALNQYREACKNRIEAMALVTGLKTMTDQIEEHTALQDYLIDNPRLCNVSIDDSYISYIVKTFLAPYLTDQYEIISKRANSFDLYATSEWSRSDIKLLLDSIFSTDRCFKLRMCSYFKLDYLGTEATSRKNFSYIETNKELKDYVPNPHFQHHNCFGQNMTAIIEQLKAGDAIGAIECTIACTQKIYIHDISFREFIQDLLRFKGKCLVLEDGTEMTPKEAIQYLKGKENV